MSNIFCNFARFLSRSALKRNIKTQDTMNLNERVIAVVGLGYVGLPLAIEYGKKYP